MYNTNLSEKRSKASLIQSFLLTVYIKKSKFSQVASTHECHTTCIKLNHIIFIQCFCSSLCCWHVHIDVHRNTDLRQLQRRVWHCFRQTHEIISRQLSGIGLKDWWIGCRPESSFYSMPQLMKFYSVPRSLQCYQKTARNLKPNDRFNLDTRVTWRRCMTSHGGD